jgi:hypothetical protein
MIQTRHAVQLGLQRHGDLLLHLLGRPAVVLGDDLEQRRSGVGVGLDVQHAGGVQTTEEEHDGQQNAQAPLLDTVFDEILDHGEQHSAGLASRPVFSGAGG